MPAALRLRSALLLGLLAACSNEARDTQSPAPGPVLDDTVPCEDDDDCEGSAVCVGRACTATGECEEDSECDTGLVCRSERCVLPVTTDVCDDSSTCRASDVCLDGQCTRTECATDDDCPDDALCAGTICRWAPPCGSDACDERGDGTCRGGLCVPSCATNADCGGTRATGCVDQRCVSVCTTSADCAPGGACTSGFCQDPQCVTSADCAEGETCSRGACLPAGGCRSNADCAEGSVCDDGLCVGGGECIRDADCGPNRVCDARTCVDSRACSSTADCPADATCIGQVCVPRLCRGNADCAGESVCEDGRCVDAPDADIASIVILTPPRAIRPGDELPLRAAALDSSQRVIPGVVFEFTPEDNDILAVRGATLVSGDTVGSTLVRARAAGTTAPVSPGVLFTNLGAPPSGELRVSLFNRASGAPLGGATVRVGDQSRTTSPDGVARFDAASGLPIEIDAEGFDLLTVVDPLGDDLLLGLRPTFRTREAAGFRGEMDFSATGSRGDARLGIAGAAIEGDLVDIGLSDLIGTTFLTPLSAGPLGSQSLPLPAGLVLAVDSFGIGDIKGTYYAQSSAGLSFAWALGGQTPANSLFGLFTGGGSLSAILRSLLPLFESFDHTVTSFVGEPRDLVPDREDVNGNGDRTELIPDYEAFPVLALRPASPLRYRTQIGFPILPTFNGRAADVAIVVGGMLVDGVGFVPTGLTATGAGTGGLNPAPVTLRMAPPSGGLSVGRFAVVLLTLEPAPPGPPGAGAGFDADGTLAARLFVGDRLPETIDFAGELFPTLPSTAALAAGRLEAQPSSVSVVRYTMEGSDRSWEVLAPGTATINTAPPTGFTPVGDEITVDGIQLRSGVTWAELLHPSGPTLRSFAEAASGFVRGRLGR
jgi:hypothetical protein